MTPAMSIFTDIAEQWQITDDEFAALESAAVEANDDHGFDSASEQRKRNDQAYFLFIFTRFEDAVNQAVKTIISNRTPSEAPWTDRRIWEAWSKLVFKDDKSTNFLSKAEVIADKSGHHYQRIREYYKGRNNIGHGGQYSEQFFIPDIARFMDIISASFPAS